MKWSGDDIKQRVNEKVPVKLQHDRVIDQLAAGMNDVSGDWWRREPARGAQDGMRNIPPACLLLDPGCDRYIFVASACAMVFGQFPRPDVEPPSLNISTDRPDRPVGRPSGCKLGETKWRPYNRLCL